MGLKIRLQKSGKRDDVFYKIVVAEREAKRDGKIHKLLGYYKPKKSPISLTINKEALEKWKAAGAKPTRAVLKLLSLLSQ